MKKQKKPIILVLVLAALFGGAAIMNKPVSNGPGQPPPAQNNDAKEDKGSVAGDVATNMKAGEQAKAAEPKTAMPKLPKKGGPGRPPIPGADGPSIIRPKIQPFKPKPSDSATSTQWYTDESPRK
jgi:hypothetical protein